MNHFYPHFLVSVNPVASGYNANENETVTLLCEMEDYIHPDSDFQWRKGAQQIMTNERYLIGYTDGSPLRAQNGGISLVPSRFSTLTIFAVKESDEGIYTCFVKGSGASADAQLIVNSGKLNSYHMSNLNYHNT